MEEKVIYNIDRIEELSHEIFNAKKMIDDLNVKINQLKAEKRVKIKRWIRRFINNHLEDIIKGAWDITVSYNGNFWVINVGVRYRDDLVYRFNMLVDDYTSMHQGDNQMDWHNLQSLVDSTSNLLLLGAKDILLTNNNNSYSFTIIAPSLDQVYNIIHSLNKEKKRPAFIFENESMHMIKRRALKLDALSIALLDLLKETSEAGDGA